MKKSSGLIGFLIITVLFLGTANASIIIDWNVSHGTADFDATNPGLESLFHYNGSNLSSVNPDHAIDIVDFDFGSDDGVYAASTDLTGWNFMIYDDKVRFLNDSGASWNYGIFNQAGFSLYGTDTSSRLGDVIGYNSIGEPSNIVSVIGPARTVPEPGTVILLAFGLLGLSGFGRKKS